MSRLSLQSVSFSYRPPAKVLDAISFSVDTGALFSIVGPSGSGKTTLLKTIAGLLSPQEGSIRLGDEDLCTQAPEKRPVVMVFQNYLLFPYLNVHENVAFGLRMQRVRQRTINREVSAMLEKLSLQGLERRRPSELSSGQQQRVALARALILKPQVLLLDEPFANLDPHLRVGVSELIQRIIGEFRISVVMVTHGIQEALMFSTRLAVFSDGRIVQCASPEEVLNCPSDAFVARFFGNENRLPALLEGDTASSEFGTLTLDAPKQQQNRRVVLTCRPEAGKIFEEGTKGRQNCLPARVCSVYRGESLLYYRLTIGRHCWTVSALSELPFQEGQKVSLHLPAAKLWCFPDE